MSNLGFIGVGIMGAPMAGHLLDGGHTLYTVKHRSPTPQALLDKGIVVAGSPREVAEHADVIFIMVPDTPPRSRRCCSVPTA